MANIKNIVFLPSESDLSKSRCWGMGQAKMNLFQVLCGVTGTIF